MSMNGDDLVRNALRLLRAHQQLTARERVILAVRALSAGEEPAWEPRAYMPRRQVPEYQQHFAQAQAAIYLVPYACMLYQEALITVMHLGVLLEGREEEPDLLRRVVVPQLRSVHARLRAWLQVERWLIREFGAPIVIPAPMRTALERTTRLVDEWRAIVMEEVPRLGVPAADPETVRALRAVVGLNEQRFREL